MIFTLDGRLRLTDCPAALRRALMEELTIPNPAYTRAAYLGLPTYSIPRELLLYEVQSNELILPRGMANDVWHRRPKDTQKRDAMTLCPVPAWPPGSIRLRSYQQKAADAVLASKTPQGVLVMPCGAGKTETGLYLIRAIGQPALWIAHTNDLVLQAAERAKARLGLTDGQIGILNGTQKRIGTHLTVATVQTLYHMELDDLAGRIGTVIVDECQHVVANPANAQMFNAVLGCLPARYRYGLTATPARGDGLEHTIHMILGDTIAQVDQQVLVDTGSTVIPQVQPVLTQFSYTPGPREQMHIDTARLRRCLAADTARNTRIVRMIAQDALHGETVLALGCGLDILETMCRALHSQSDFAAAGLNAHFICGATKAADRTAALRELKDPACPARVLFATYQLAKEGLDIPCAGRLYLVQPVRDKVSVQQAVGRIMRPAPGKTTALVYDFVDNNVPACRSQYAARRRVYKQLNAEILEETTL